MNMPKLKNLRADLAFISSWVKDGAHVLDLGCDDGAMLEYLQKTKNCTGYGVEIDDLKIPGCVLRGISVIQHNLEKGLPFFKDDSFDTVLCLSALQMMQHVEGLLREMARVGNEAIVSFPNFAYWPHRFSLLGGKMPVSLELPYEWYDTPNLRCATLKDFENLADLVGRKVADCVALHDGKPVTFMPNWRGSLAVFRLQKKINSKRT